MRFLHDRSSWLLVLLLVTQLHAFADDKGLVARWDFDTEETEPIVAKGNFVRDQIGPRPPEFPDMDIDNTAVHLDGKGARLEIQDPGTDSPYDFKNGDAITLEAWVNVEKLARGHFAYIISKGRTMTGGRDENNQNWAMRVVGATGNTAQVGFLFTTIAPGGKKEWHRWSSDTVFEITTGWHHIALGYEFGKPESMKGWIDGLPTGGKWDLEGPTRNPPVVDDDAVWIGSSRGGSPGNSFHGLLDAVAIHRIQLSDETIARRFNSRNGPRVIQPGIPEMPTLGRIKPDGVLVQFNEGLPDYARWPNTTELPDEADRWITDSFLLPRVPLRYDSWGIRSAWKAPILIRIAADMELPEGERRFMVRTRGLARLWIDGKQVAETKPAVATTPNGHERVTPLAEPPHPGVRVKDYHHQEVFGTIDLPKKEGLSRVILEVIAGGKNQRTETGEICVAIENEEGDAFSVLTAGKKKRLPLTDKVIEPVLARLDSELNSFDDRNRRAAVTSRDGYWKKRHDLAREWARKNPSPTPPGLDHPIDAFIDARIEKALASSSGNTPEKEGISLEREVLSILREECFRCHGDKDKGGLKLDSLEAAMKGGDSELPAIIPGDPHQSELLKRLKTTDEDLLMPPTGESLPEEQIAAIEKWISTGAKWPAAPIRPEKIARTPTSSDEAFLRRIHLDIVGVPPTAEEARGFLNDPSPDKRIRLIDRLLADERWADHQMGWWLDMLAENPTLINPSLNSTGPFRWFIHDAMRDHKSYDRFATELLMMRGDAAHGGSAGFALAAENDAPYAAKGHIAASTFLGIELQCARCHDSPYHSTTQRDLYSLAAMLERKPTKVPKTSRVPAGFFEKKGRESLIKVTLKPDAVIQPDWPFAEATGVKDGPNIDRLLEDPKDSRARFAALITSPENTRFPAVLVNHLWKQLMGAGFIEPAHDWEGRDASHPELLEWLAKELVANDYDPRHVIRLIVTSKAYQRMPGNLELASTPARERFFTAPARRRLTAEQIVDSLHTSAGKEIDSEELTFVHDGRHLLGRRQTLGRPTRGWMFASLNNERDRPSLALPHAQTTVDVLEAFGWNGSRQMPVFERSTDPNVLQPGVLANGLLVQALSRASHESELAELAVQAPSARALLEELFLRFLSRKPTTRETKALLPALSEGFDERLVPKELQVLPKKPKQLPLATWLNHVTPEANSIQLEVEKQVQKGPTPDPRLKTEWRTIYEDIIWSLINHREFVWMP